MSVMSLYQRELRDYDFRPIKQLAATSAAIGARAVYNKYFGPGSAMQIDSPEASFLSGGGGHGRRVRYRVRSKKNFMRRRFGRRRFRKRRFRTFRKRRYTRRFRY